MAFLIDTGSSASFMPATYLEMIGANRAEVVSDLIKRNLEPNSDGEFPSGLHRPDGTELMGVPFDTEICIPGLRPITHEIWFCNDVTYAVLGNRGWFESVGATFMNWPSPDHAEQRMFFLFHREEATNAEAKK